MRCECISIMGFGVCDCESLLWTLEVGRIVANLNCFPSRSVSASVRDTRVVLGIFSNLIASNEFSYF